jgi:hypothetical protein
MTSHLARALLTGDADVSAVLVCRCLDGARTHHTAAHTHIHMHTLLWTL